MSKLACEKHRWPDGMEPCLDCIHDITQRGIIDTYREEIKSLELQLEEMTKHANEGWALANTRTKQWKDTELQLKDFADQVCDMLEKMMRGGTPEFFKQRYKVEALAEKYGTPEVADKKLEPSCYMCKGTGERGGFPCPECAVKREGDK